MYFFSQGRRASAFRCFTEAQEAAQSCCVQLSEELSAISHCAKWSVVISKYRSGFSFSLSPQFICSLSSLCEIPADLLKAYIDIKVLKLPCVGNCHTCPFGLCLIFTRRFVQEQAVEVSAKGLLLHHSFTLEEANGSSTTSLNRGRVRPAWVCCWLFLSWLLLQKPSGFPAHGIPLVRSASPFLGIARGMIHELYCLPMVQGHTLCSVSGE